jgi:hypothetical protein
MCRNLNLPQPKCAEKNPMPTAAPCRNWAHLGETGLNFRRDLWSLPEARRCLFYPSPEDMRTRSPPSHKSSGLVPQCWGALRLLLRYPRMVLSPPAGLEFSEKHPQRRIQAPALTLFYFVHQHSWGLVRPFVLGGVPCTYGSEDMAQWFGRHPRRSFFSWFDFLLIRPQQ